MNIIQGTKPSGRKWNRLLYEVVTILKYKRSTIDHAIFIKFFYYGTVSYLIVFTDDVIVIGIVPVPRVIRHTARPQQSAIVSHEMSSRSCKYI